MKNDQAQIFEWMNCFSYQKIVQRNFMYITRIVCTKGERLFYDRNSIILFEFLMESGVYFAGLL